MTIVIGGLIALVGLVWGWDLAAGTGPAGGTLPWVARQEALYLTGLLSIAFMSLAMMLATRPAWLERPLGGLDRMYRLHKWSGILAVGFGALHWLVELSDDLLKALAGRTGRVPEEHHTGVLEALRDVAEDAGEWAIYVAIAMLAITLWRRFPYGLWRRLHALMPLLYLTLAFHAALLAPSHYWGEAVGALLAVLLAGGTTASIHSLAGRIGRGRVASGTVTAVQPLTPEVLEVTCRLDEGWRGHRAGQFAFVTFDRLEGAHPFTIASADRGDRTVTFEIKALGRYTRGLADRLRPGQMVKVEGPYGRFDLTAHDRRARQLWVAGGIGITPFIAWLESLLRRPDHSPQADLHYCTRDRDADPLVAKVQALCAGLPNVRLHVHDAGRGERLTGEALAAGLQEAKRTEVWFCGPRPFARALEEGLRRRLGWRLRFRQEAFELR